MGDFDYQLWQRIDSGERFAVKLNEYVPADKRNVVAGSREDQRYEASLIVGVQGPIYCASGHNPLTIEGLKAVNYDVYVGWIRDHSAEFRRVEPISENACLLCGEQHEPAEVQMTAAQILDKIREHRRDALEYAEGLEGGRDADLAQGWIVRANGFQELLESIPGTPEEQELAERANRLGIDF